MPTGNNKRDALSCARQGALTVCKKLMALQIPATSGSDRERCGPSKAAGRLRDMMESLVTRARQAPSLAATWGVAATLVFYASKAAELTENEQQLQFLLYLLTDNGAPPSYDQLCRIDATAAGYAFYIAAFQRAHSCITDGGSYSGGAVGGGTGDIVKILDGLVKDYMMGMHVGKYQAIALIENLARFATLYIEPLTAEIPRNVNSYNEIKNIINNICSLS